MIREELAVLFRHRLGGRADGRIQGIDPLRERVEVLLEHGRALGVELGELITDDLGELLRVGGIRPEVGVREAFGSWEREVEDVLVLRDRAVRELHDAHPVADVRLRELARRLFQMEAVDEDDVGVLHHRGVRGSGLERVAVHPFGHDPRHGDAVAPDVLHDVRDRRDRGDDLDARPRASST
jgi:hypothetical protein